MPARSVPLNSLSGTKRLFCLDKRTNRLPVRKKIPGNNLSYTGPVPKILMHRYLKKEEKNT